jgi:hypothetical protein
LAFGTIALYIGHPYEDAYIVFKYIDNFASGRGIVYYPGGPHTEGFVDFLWVMVLSALVKIGFDVAFAAVFCTALAAGAVAAIYARWKTPDTRFPLYALFLSAVLFSRAALAGYGGFASMVFSAITLALYACVVEGSFSSLMAIPWLGLMAALLRADGVVIATGFTGVGAFLAWRSNAAKSFFGHVFAVTVLAVVYYICRFSYFGLALPLPLYVKKTGFLWERLSFNLKWLFSPYGAAIPVLWLFGMRRPLRDALKEQWKRMCLGFIPIAMYFAALSFAMQAQNVHRRFQSPIMIVLIFACFLAVCHLQSDRFKRHRLVIIAYVLFLTVQGMMLLADFYQRRGDYGYLNTFSALLSRRLPLDKTMVITEAGCLAYWNRGKVVDLVGLNDPYAATHDDTTEYLEQLNPDILMWDHHRTMYGVKKEGDPNVKKFDSQMIRGIVQPRYEPYLLGERVSGAKLYKAAMAPMVMSRYFFRHENEYELYGVFYWGNYQNYYAIRKNLEVKKQILDDLAKTTDGYHLSYAQIKGFWPFQPLDSLLKETS